MRCDDSTGVRILPNTNSKIRKNQHSGSHQQYSLAQFHRHIV
jgi:hypothetical protein